jgi:hypothetical protein
MTMQFDWPYFNLRPDGILVYEDTRVPIAIAKDGSTPWFANAADAEEFLVAEDIRGNVR